MWNAKWQVGTAFVYGRQREIRWKEIICLWRVLGWEVPVKAIVAYVEGYKQRFTLVTSAVELTGLQMVELFTARFRQEDGRAYAPLFQGLRTTFSCVFEGFLRELSSNYIINTNCDALYSPITYRKVATK